MRCASMTVSCQVLPQTKMRTAQPNQIQGVTQVLRCLSEENVTAKGGKKKEAETAKRQSGEPPLYPVVLEREFDIHVAVNTLICAKKSADIAVAIRAVSPWAGHCLVAFCINNFSGWLSVNTFRLSPMRASVSVAVGSVRPWTIILHFASPPKLSMKFVPSWTDYDGD